MTIILFFICQRICFLNYLLLLIFSFRIYLTLHTNNLMVVQPTTLAPDEEHLGPLIERDYEINNYFICDSENENHIINIFNKIDKTEAGRTILTTLKTLLGDPPQNQKIEFKVVNQNTEIRDWCTKRQKEEKEKYTTEDIKTLYDEIDKDSKGILIERANCYAFDLTETLKNENENLLIVNINKEFLYHERFVFDGEKIVALNLEKMLGSKEAAEAYLVAHELVHCIQFLSNENNIMGGKEDKDWESFLQTLRMKNIYDALKANYSDGDIYGAFKNLFKNVEEARNLLGFVPENRQDLPAIGEFFLFNEKNNYCLPVYLDMDGLSKAQKDTCKTVLKTIANAEEFKISLQTGSMDTTERKYKYFWFPHF